MRVTSNHWNTFLACHGKGLRSLRPRLRLRTKEIGPDPVPKRGGCPLKRKAASIGDSETEGLDQLKDGNDGKGPDDEPEPKRRGLPPKKKPVLIDNSGVGSETGGEGEHEHGADGKGPEQPEPKRRVRLRKSLF